jgi:hypothetical protein
MGKPAFSGRAVVVHSLAQARAAVAAAAALGRPVVLLSAPGAAGYAGPGWFAKLVDLAVESHPEAEVASVLDCADKPGLVLAALRQGLPAVRFTGRRAAAAKLAAIAADHGAELLTGRIRALDLRGQEDPEPACRAWLDGGKQGKDSE